MTATARVELLMTERGRFKLVQAQTTRVMKEKASKCNAQMLTFVKLSRNGTLHLQSKKHLQVLFNKIERNTGKMPFQLCDNRGE